MDGDIEKILGLLLDAGLPATITDVRNPTAEFIHNLFIAFLLKHGYDANTILKPTIKQFEASVNPDSSYYQIISFVNLYVSMNEICQKIFITDFCLTDITSPGPKRARRQAKFLSNFILYKNKKVIEIEDEMKKPFNTYKMYSDFMKNEEQNYEKIMQKEHEIQELLKKKEKRQKLIEKIRQQFKVNTDKNNEIEELQKIKEQSRLKTKEVLESLTEKARQGKKKVEEYQAKIIVSPEEYQARLEDLKQEQKCMEESRTSMFETIGHKKQQITELEKRHNIIQQEYEKLGELKAIRQNWIEVQKTLKETNILTEELISTNQKLDHTNSLRKRECQDYTDKKDKLNAQCKEKLSPLHKMYLHRSNEKKSATLSLEETRAHLHKMHKEKVEICETIKNITCDISRFLKMCQEAYNEEIRLEQKTEAPWSQFPN